MLESLGLKHFTMRINASSLCNNTGVTKLIGNVALFSIALFACFAAYTILYASSPRTYTVELRDAGFFPTELTLRNGDTVIFKNVGTRAMWPASDPHPTHEDLSPFDPQDGIEPGQSWTYTFTTPGSWRYHDHFNVTSQGEIVVLRNSGARPDSVTSGHCDGPCFDELIRDTVHSEGIDAAFKIFEATYAQGQLPRACHWTAHEIGEAGYDLFRSGKNFSISVATTYCGYGFYHGFMEQLLRENPDPAYALRFCDTVKAQLGDMGLWNCYHGIGHGYTEDPPEPSSIGDFQKIIAPGIAMCEYLFNKDFRNLNLCLTGVFTVPVNFAADEKYGLSMDPSDPFAVCRTQPYLYWKACYGEFAAKLDTVLEWDIRRLPPYVQSLPDEKLKRLVVWVVPSVMMAKDILAPEHSRYIEECRVSFTGQLRRICWGGSILGFFQHGEPQMQYEKILDFCNAEAWKSADERMFCWGEGLRQMRQNYPLDKVKNICPSVPEQYRYLCLDVEHTHRSPYDDPSFDTK